MNRERTALLYEIKGYLRMLEDCCEGRNVHLAANLKTSLSLALGLVERSELHPDRLASLARTIREQVGPRVKKHYGQWISRGGRPRYHAESGE